MKDLINFSSKLPTVSKTYATFDIVGNTVGRYFDYKRETQLINAEIKKIENQTKAIIAKIDSELKKHLKDSKKDFKKEIKRLKNIDNELKSNSKTKAKLLKLISETTLSILNSDIPTEDKILLLNEISKYRESLNKSIEHSMNLIYSMTNYNPNKAITKKEAE